MTTQTAALAIANAADTTLFWSNADGWVATGYDTFTALERETLPLPLGGAWTTAHKATAPVYVIAKAGMHGARYVVTAIRQGGLRLDNVRVEPGREAVTLWQARTFATLKAAERARETLATVGLYDDYFVMPLDAFATA